MKPALILLPASFLLAVFLVPGQDLPAGTGKDLVERLCTQCHGLESVTSHHATKDEWQATVEYMRSRGMEATDEQVTTIVDYLAKAFPPETPKKSVPKK